MSEPRPEPAAGLDRDVWDSPTQREYEADPAAYEARVAARYEELQAAEAEAARLQADLDAAADAEFWAVCEAEGGADPEAEIG
jgi:hypothetical protein